jgi:hypothetical protein
MGAKLSMPNTLPWKRYASYDDMYSVEMPVGAKPYEYPEDCPPTPGGFLVLEEPSKNVYSVCCLDMAGLSDTYPDGVESKSDRGEYELEAMQALLASGLTGSVTARHFCSFRRRSAIRYSAYVEPEQGVKLLQYGLLFTIESWILLLLVSGDEPFVSEGFERMIASLEFVSGEKAGAEKRSTRH